MATASAKATEIIDRMMEKDYFSQWLGVERVSEGEGFCTLRMQIRKEMCNGFEIAHGGISFSFADSAFAFAANSRGRVAVSMESSVAHIKPLRTGDIILAIAEEKHVGKRTGHYDVRVQKENGDLMALFKGTVFIKSAGESL